MLAQRLTRLGAAALLAAAAGCGLVSSTLTPGPTAPPTHTAPPPTLAPLPRQYPLPHLDQPQYGIQAFLWWFVDNKTGWRDADLVRDMGFQWIKQQFSWRDIASICS